MGRSATVTIVATSVAKNATQMVVSLTSPDPLVVGARINIQAILTDLNNTPLPNKAITWRVYRPDGAQFNAGTSITDINGVIEGVVGVSDQAGTWMLTGEFVGDFDYESSGNTTTIVIASTPPTTYSLTISSTPSGVSFTLDATSHTTPYTETLVEGSHTITMPQTVTIDSTTYTFKQWEDGSTSLTRTINLTSDLSITATYEAGAPPLNPLLILGLVVGVVAVTAVVTYYT